MEDVNQYPWLHLRNTTYYLRAPVPTEIQKVYGRKQVWISLKTKGRKEAIRKLRELTPQVLKAFDECTHPSGSASAVVHEVTREQLENIQKCYLSELMDQDEQKRESGFEGFDFEEDADWLETLDLNNREEYAQGRVSEFMLEEARDVLSWTNIEINLAEDSPSWSRVARALYAAFIQYAELKRKRNKGDVVVTPEYPKALIAPPKGPTLYDAKAFYIAEKITSEPFARKKAVDRIERMVVTVEAALGEVLPLADWTVDHAYQVRDYLLAKGTLKPSSVRRELNTIKGIFSFYIARKQRTLANPFSGMELPVSAVIEKDVRSPLPVELIDVISLQLEKTANRDLYLIWLILAGTGCRLAEVTGLRLIDAHLSSDISFLRIVDHETRRLKTISSVRDVPLVGAALEAVREAIDRSGSERDIFPRYAGPKGPNTASATLMKQLRKVTMDPCHTVHSLRHSFADRCDLAGVNAMDKSAILGHHNDSTTEKHYSSRSARLKVLYKAMLQAYELAA